MKQGEVQRVPLQGLGKKKGFMWFTNREGDDGHMLVGIKPWNHMGLHGCLLICYSLRPLFIFCVMATITTTGASHITCPTQLCFCSTVANRWEFNLSSNPRICSTWDPSFTVTYFWLFFLIYLLFPLLGHQPLNSTLQGETRHLWN